MPLFNQKVPCVSCNTPINRNSNFCPSCGSGQDRGQVSCSGCHAKIPASAKYCPKCGIDVQSSQSPRVVDNRWVRQAGEIAARFSTTDIVGRFRSPLIIEPGTKAIVMTDGTVSGVVGAGSYTMDSLTEQFSRFVRLRAVKRMSAVVVDDHSFDLAFEVKNLFTSDPLKVHVDVMLQVFVNDPLRFLEERVRSASRYMLADLQKHLAGQVQNGVESWINGRSIDDLRNDFEGKTDLEDYLSDHLRQTLLRSGLTLSQLTTFNYRSAQVDRIQELNQEYLIIRTQKDTKLQGKKSIFDVFQEEERHKLVKDTFSVEMFEQRSDVRQRVREAVQKDEFAELKTNQQKADFLRQIDKDNLLSGEEWTRLQRIIDWRNDDQLRQRDEEVADHAWARQIVVDDRERDRAYLLARIDLENEYDLGMLELTQRIDLEPQQLTHEHSMRMAELEGSLAYRVKEQEGEIALQRQKREFERQETEFNDILDREKQLRANQTQIDIAKSQAQSEAERRQLERDEDQADAELGILLLSKMKAVRLKDEADRQKMRLDAEHAELKMRIEEAEAAHKRELAKLGQEQQFELDWVNQIKDLSPKALIAAARDTERAAILGDLQQTEAMQDMNESQILAMMAKDSPEAAQAVAEIARAAADGKFSAERQKLYEQLLAQKDNETNRFEKLFQDTTKQMQEMMNKSLDSQKDTAVQIAQATSRAVPPSSPIIVTGAGGGTTMASGGGQSGSAVRCPNCHEMVESEANFCPNCRYKLRGANE